MKLPSHIIHSPEFINCNKLAETKLPDGHTRQERIEEIKQIAKKYQGVNGMFLYASIKIEQINNFSDEFYQQWVTDLKEIEKKYQELKEKAIVINAIPGDELPKDINGNKADLETHIKSPDRDLLEKQIRGLMDNPEIELSEKDYNTFLQLVTGMTFEAGTSEMALAFITIAIMDKDKLIVERNNREDDFKTLINIIIYIYRHVFDPKSTLLLLTEALDIYMPNDDSFRLILIHGNSDFEEVIKLVRKPIEPQPQFYS